MSDGSCADSPVPGLIGPDEAATIFTPIIAHIGAGAVLAVSGGSDSMALMHLFARWMASRGESLQRFHVATIDHGLRTEASADAEFVVAAARDLGFTAHLRRWVGPKPETGRAQAARQVRYHLLSEVTHALGVRVLLTAHTADDQAETLLMRLARGSGIDGLAGMAPMRPLQRAPDNRDDVMLIRPLLGVEKARLRADLKARGIAWREDPTNADLAYERPRYREAEAALSALDLTPTRLGLSARRLRRASEALGREAADFLAGRGGQVHPLGLVQIDAIALFARAEEIGLRVLRRAVEIAGGAQTPVSLSALERLYDALCTGKATAGTLARGAVRRHGDTLFVEREPGREKPPPVALTPAQCLIWDGRFRIEVQRTPANCVLAPLGAEGLSTFPERGIRRPRVPARTLRSLPAVWCGDQLVFTPVSGFVVSPPLQLDVRMALLGLPVERVDRQAEASS